MKRFTPLAWMISLLVVGSYVVLARPTAPVEPAMVRACSVSDVVAAAMTQRQLFATEDLGIIVLALPFVYRRRFGMDTLIHP